MENLERIEHPEYFSFQKNHTLGFFNTSENLEQALTALRSHGMDDSFFRLYEGESGIHAIDLDGDKHSMMERYARLIQKIYGSGDWRLLEDADSEIREGHFLLSVFTEDDEAKAEIVEVFKAFGAHDIRYLSPIYVEEISIYD